ncbi:DUF4184 family protein [Nocardia seriolae]|uniref:DUF4184 family protein n=1 Tax=Nocardia seriolae TaxID=37332 RepID=A0ABC9YL94_9NOCA|nr:DUF4184 family protein [Nocardia seriolae]APA95550.1 hypothetical protein NS506_01479 [Nocardia seriolae]OJF78204.1 hypothetical protein NS14008_01975 [Nocardia seriolae]QOW31577.1 DUF4184 family protein [Nocardia seriolae]QUN19189.1 DUF4184 family protein [Nocardia seriolae]WNJ58620.1 DUF4184 family protein [Nocardia seriolae]
MPFTLAHPAAVLPLRRALWFPGLFAGSIAPDVPYYLPIGVTGELTHSLPGLPVDVLLGAILVGIAWALRRSVEGMLAKAITMSRPGPVGAVAALLIGAVTHLVWDAFTHTDGLAVRHWELLRESVIGPHRVYNVIGYVSSIGGMLLLAGCLAVWYRRARPAPADPRRVWILVSLTGIALLAGLLARTDPVARISLYDCVRHMLIYAITSAGTGFVGYALVVAAASVSRGHR